MVNCGTDICPNCGGKLKYFDRVRRLVRGKYGRKSWIWIRRLKCEKCRRVHREIPSIIFPYKHYEAEIIKGVIEGLITPDILGFENYPCELTMKRWSLTLF